ncbi:MAG: hypothetical protein LVR00_03240 [Rhabdochlamydiaceae bacterium]
MVFFRLFPAPPTPQEIADRRIEEIVRTLHYIETYSFRTQREHIIPFIKSFLTTDPIIPIPDLLKALSSYQLCAISAHERTMGSILLLEFLLKNSGQLEIKKEELISSVEIFIKVYERYFEKGYDQRKEEECKQVFSGIQSLIPKLVEHALESYVLEIVSVYNRKKVTIHQAPVDWFIAWLKAMMERYGKERVEKELDLEEWACRVRKANQPSFISIDSNEETLASMNSQEEAMSRLMRLTSDNIQSIIAVQRAENWHKIREAARILGNRALEEEAS